MDTLSLVAIAVAAVVAVIGLVRAAGATKELAAARAELAEVKAALQASREELRALAAPKQKKPADPKPPEPAPPKAAQPKPSPPKPEPPEPPPSEPKLDPEVVKRAEVMLRDARLMARHVGFEAQLEVNGRKGVRVPVEVTTDTDEQAIAHLQSTSDAVLDVGTRNGERFLVVRV